MLVIPRYLFFQSPTSLPCIHPTNIYLTTCLKYFVAMSPVALKTLQDGFLGSWKWKPKFLSDHKPLGPLHLSESTSPPLFTHLFQPHWWSCSSSALYVLQTYAYLAPAYSSALNMRSLSASNLTQKRYLLHICLQIAMLSPKIPPYLC